MISLQTNLSNIVTQNNLMTSTNRLNQAIERMSTGYKINHASDNAANYSISKNMNMQLSACDIAADNISMGMDLLQTAQDTISGMQERGQRIQALITQARNGTYGATSLTAISQEVQSIAEEISRLYINTEYNGIKLLEPALPDWAKQVMADAGECAGLQDEVNLNPEYNEESIYSVELPDYIINSAGQNHGGEKGFLAPIEEIVLDPENIANAENLMGLLKSETKVIGIGDIDTLRELCHISEQGFDFSDKDIVLTDDIDMKGDSCVISGDFAGTFDGTGHTISNFVNDGCGLFSSVSGKIKNLSLNNCTVDGKNNRVGLLVNDLEEGIIANCHVSGTVSGNIKIGGLVGHASNGTVNDSYSECTVNGYETVGGLVGYANKSEITNSYSAGTVNGNDGTGGLVGIAEDSGIGNSYSVCTVIGQNNVGGLVGYANGGGIQSSYSSCTVGGEDKVGGLIGDAEFMKLRDTASLGKVSGNSCTGSFIGYADDKTLNDLRSSYIKSSGYYMIGSTPEYEASGDLTVINTQISHRAGYRGLMNGFDETTPDIIANAKNLMDLLKSETKVIGIGDIDTLRELCHISEQGFDFSDKDIVLTDDIDMKGDSCVISCVFAGTFDGNGHTISNFVNDVCGLFSSVSGKIKNLSLNNCTVDGKNDDVGLLVKDLEGGIIANCHVSGTVSGNFNIGGLVGYASNGTVNDSYSECTVNGYETVGGLVGYANKSKITNSYSAGTVNGNNETGGLVGTAEYSDIGNSYSVCTVGGEDKVGGLVGHAKGGGIQSSYSSCTVGGKDKVGGLVGHASDISISYSYSSGNVYGEISSGGFAGKTDGCSIEYSYSTGEVHGVDAGGFVCYCENCHIDSCYATGNVTGVDTAGGFGLKVDYVNNSFCINSVAVESEKGDVYDFVKTQEVGEYCGAFKGNLQTTFNVGIYGDSSSQISVNTTFMYNLALDDLTSDSAFESITNFLNMLNQKSVKIGAAQNRLESALESTLVKIDNLTSSLSTIRDADIGKVSSDYIRQQILQQACATLMATANQSPSIALQLL